MRRTTAAGLVAGRRTAGNPLTGILATRRDPDYDNLLEDEICAVIAAAGITLDGANSTQLLAALRGMFAMRQSQTFSTAGSSSWTVPANVTRIEVLVIGGGGGGSDCNNTGLGYRISGGGGGAGGAAQGIYTVTPGTVYTVTVGAGGARQSNGGTTSFGALISATGGFGASFSNNVVSPGGLGGQGSGGTVFSVPGEPGQSGQTYALIFPGRGGGSLFSGAGAAISGENSPAVGPGSGGGGVYDPVQSNSVFAGSAGAPGIVIVKW
jgi:hypothetical protein